jgi:hypothetical protein
MSYLLLPQDETGLVRYMCEELGLVLLLSDVTDRGVPIVAAHPLTAVSNRLPIELATGGTLIFWCRDFGPVRTLADAPAPVEPADRVAASLTREAAGARFSDLIDLTRTPVIRWRRARFRREGQLKPALLQSMPIKVRDYPPEVLRVHRQIERWLKKHGEKVNPFDHCSDPAVPQPRNLGPFWVWVHPHALEWIWGGGEIWPWPG